MDYDSLRKKVYEKSTEQQSYMLFYIMGKMHRDDAFLEALDEALKLHSVK